MMYMEEGILKNKVVTKLLAYMMASAILATTITGGLVMQPVTVMAEETQSVQVSAKYTFDKTSEWDNNGGKRKQSFSDNSGDTFGRYRLADGCITS